MNWIKSLDFKWVFYGLGLMVLLTNNWNTINNNFNKYLDKSTNYTQIYGVTNPLVTSVILAHRYGADHHYRDENILSLIHP